MHILTWTDKDGRHKELRFPVKRFAETMKKYLLDRSYEDVKLTTILRDAYEVDPATLETLPIVKNIALSRLTVEIRELLTDNPDVHLIITPPSRRQKPDDRKQA